MDWIAARRAAWVAAALGVTAWPAVASRDAAWRAPEVPAEDCAVPVAAAPAAAPAPVLLDGLGYAGIEPDSDNDEARAWFAQGVRLIWAFDEVEAIRAFQQAQRLDPNCAMCYFGEAWARGPTINLSAAHAELAAARAAVARAASLSARLGARDRLILRGMEIRTRRGADFSNEAYATFMEGAALRMPGDDTLAIMAADARMVAWGETVPPPGSLAQQLLERVLARNPDHGGAIHYLHPPDRLDRPPGARRAACRAARPDRAGGEPPRPHALAQLLRRRPLSGRGRGQRRGDRRRPGLRAAGAAGGVRLSRRPPRPQHALRDRKRARPRRRRHRARRVAASSATTYLTGEIDGRVRVLGASTFYARGLHDDVEAVLALPVPAHVFDKAQRHYARGEALARRGEAAAVRAEAAAIAALRAGRDSPALGRRGEQLAEVFQYVLEGRAAMLAGDPGAGGGRLSQGDGAPARLRFRQRSAALLVFGAPQPRRGDAGERRPSERPGQLYASLRSWPNDALALYAAVAGRPRRRRRRDRRPQPRPGARALGRRRHPGAAAADLNRDSPYLI